MNINLGNCWFCNQPVLAGEGQMVKHLVRTNPRTGEQKRYPTHKACRKNQGVDSALTGK